MELIFDYATPVELTGFAREALADREINQPSLARWLPTQTIPDLQFRFNRGDQSLVEAAAYRAYDAETRIGNRRGLTRVTGELPALGEKLRLTEYQQLRQRNLPEAITEAVFNDALALTRKIGARLELARGDAIVNGSVTIAEDGVQATVDFGRSPSHTVTAATAWTDTANATPLDDLLSWSDTYNNTNGGLPGTILTSRRVIGLLLRSQQLINQAAGSASGVSLLTLDQVNAILNSFGLPALETYDAQFIGPDGQQTRVIPDDRVIFLPAGTDMTGTSELGATLMGQTLESEEPDYAIAPGDQPGIVVANYRTRDPIALWTHAAAIGLPIMANPDLTFVADVA